MTKDPSAAITASELVAAFNHLAQLRAHRVLAGAEYSARKQQLIADLRDCTIAEQPEAFMAALSPLIDKKVLTPQEADSIRDIVLGPPDAAPAPAQEAPADHCNVQKPGTEPFGPVPAAEIVDAIASRRLDPDSLVCAAGGTEWVSLSGVPEFAAAIQPTAWYLARGELEPAGPFSTEELLGGVRDGQVPLHAWIQKAGADAWVPLDAVPELRDQLRPKAAPGAKTTGAGSWQVAAIVAAVALGLFVLHAVVFKAGLWLAGLLLLLGIVGAVLVVALPSMRKLRAAELVRLLLAHMPAFLGAAAFVLLVEAAALTIGILDLRNRARVRRILADSDPCAVESYPSMSFMDANQWEPYTEKTAACRLKRERAAQAEYLGNQEQLESQRRRIARSLAAGKLEAGDASWIMENYSQDQADLAGRIAGGSLTTKDLMRTKKEVPFGDDGWNLFVSAAGASSTPWNDLEPGKLSPELWRSLRSVPMAEETRQVLHFRAEYIVARDRKRCTNTVTCGPIKELCDVDATLGIGIQGRGCARLIQVYAAMAKKEEAANKARAKAEAAKAAADEITAKAKADLEERRTGKRSGPADREAFAACVRKCDVERSPAQAAADDGMAAACNAQCGKDVSCFAGCYKPSTSLCKTNCAQRYPGASIGP